MAIVKTKDYRFTQNYADDFGGLIESLQYPSGTTTFVQQLEYALKNITHPHRYIEFWPDHKVYQCAEMIDHELQAIIQAGITAAKLNLAFATPVSHHEFQLIGEIVSKNH